MSGAVLFDPLVPLWLLIGLAGLAFAAASLAVWRGLSGWPWRALAGLVILLAIANPAWQVEERVPLTDIVLMVEDQSASNRLKDRSGQVESAAETLAAAIAARPNTELRRIPLGDGPDDSGTLLMEAVTAALAEEPRARVAGVIALTDGRAHDGARLPDLPAPFHVLLTGEPEDWDRRLIVENAPAFAILGEPVTLSIRVEDAGAAPQSGGRSPISISVDGGPAEDYMIDLGRTVELPLTLPHGGRNVIRFAVPASPGEVTDRNNAAVIQINGVRDRLRVLLVSGEPHPGGRTWRNLLKSDSSVDLVHFTILRPPEKQDGVPVDELSLIAFPTRELFLEKIDDFDLIIFDRYRRRGILPNIYLENVRDYVKRGGTVLVAAGKEFASAESLFRSPLGEVMPARPTARVVEEAYRPAITDLGQRHPVTAGLAPLTAEGGEGDWGRWLRQIELVAQSGSVVMSGADGRPLLVLDRVEEGRVALLASDQAWLWDRGFEGGGPQLELLRRLAHWMLKEPDLEEEALWAEPVGQTMRIIRRSVAGDVGTVRVETPTGETVEVPLTEVRPGQYEAEWTGPDIGLYRLTEGTQMAVVGLGPAAPTEFEETIADATALTAAVESRRGGVMRLSEGVPDLRSAREGRPAAGRGWIGLTPRAAFQTRDITRRPLMPAWLALLLASGLIVGGWLREGRRSA